MAVQTACPRGCFVIGLEDVQRAGMAAAGYGVDEDQRVPFLEQVIGQVHPPDSVVDDLDHRIILRQFGIADHFGAESVIPQEAVADPGYQDAGCHAGTAVRRP